MNPYEELGLNADATPEEIKKAYQKKAQKAHPDKATGDVVVFKKLKEAYEILSDAERREEFDKTGNTDAPPDVNGRALAELAGLLGQVISQVDVDYNDIVELMQNEIESVIQQSEAAIKKNETDIKKYLGVIKRTKVKGNKENMMAGMVQAFILQRNQVITANQKNIVMYKRMLELLADYDYSFDIKPQAGFGYQAFYSA